MELTDYLRVIRKRWRLIVACAVLATAAAAALSLRATPQYQSKTQFFVSTNTPTTDPSQAYNGSLFSQARVTSYADIMNGPLLAQAVSRQLGGRPSAAVIQNEVSASSITNTVLLDVTVTDQSPRRAQQIAAAIGAAFPPIATQIEASGVRSSPVKVSVVKPATFSSQAVSPNTTRDVALALMIGLLLGVALAVLRETLDTTVKDAGEISKDFELPTLGAIAYDPEAPKRPLVVQVEPRSPRAEAFRQLRTNLQFIDVDHVPRSIVISSSIPEEGKTTTATNLAITIAQSGSRVLIVEGDLRRPRLAQYLGLEGAIGLTNVLAGNRTLDEAIQPWGNGQLHVLASGPTPPNPSELLGSQGMADVVQQLERSYDMVLIDAPPLLPVTDAAVVASATGGVILVVRHGRTKHKQLMHAVDALRSVDATLYGVVLTMVPTKGPEAYYYGYNYRYDTEGGRRRAEPESAKPGGQPQAAVATNGSTRSSRRSRRRPQPVRTDIPSASASAGVSKVSAAPITPAAAGAAGRPPAPGAADDDPFSFFSG